MNPKQRLIVFAALVVTLVTVIGCGAAAEFVLPAAPAPIPTSMPIPTPTPAPTSSPVPTRTPVPSPAFNFAPGETGIEEEELKRSYDPDSSSVVSTKALFDYFWQVTGSFLEVDFFTNDQNDFRLAVPMPLPPDKETRGQGVVARGWVLSLSHVVNEEDMWERFDSDSDSDLNPDTIPQNTKFPLELVHMAHYFRWHKDGKEYMLERVVFHADQDTALLAPDTSGFRGSKPSTPLDLSLFPQVKFGVAEDLEPGDLLYVVTAESIKEAVVSEDQTFEDASSETIALIVRFLKREQIYKSNSGSAMFALRNGIPELVGLLHGAGEKDANRGVMIKISTFRKNFPQLTATK